MARARSAPAPQPELTPEEQERLEHEEEEQQASPGEVQRLDVLDERTVYQRMLAIIDELPAIGKTQRNEQQHFNFRGHDDVMNALSPLLAKHGVFIVPRVIERLFSDSRVTANNKTMYEVNLHVEYTFYGLLGDSFTSSAWGEGTDMGDKSTNKAMTMAFKNVVAQSFAINTEEASKYDADKTSPEETAKRSDVAVEPQPTVPPNWSEALRRFDHLLGSNGEGAAWLEEMIERLYGASSVGDLDGEQRQVVWVGFCSTLMMMEERYGELAFKPAVRGLIQQAFLEKCKPLRDAGIVLEGPAWALDATEAETRPQKGADPVAGEEPSGG